MRLSHELVEKILHSHTNLVLMESDGEFGCNPSSITQDVGIVIDEPDFMIIMNNHYQAISRELNRRPMYEYRCDERLEDYHQEKSLIQMDVH